MSEVAKPTETTPAPDPAVEATSTPAPSTTPAGATTEPTPVADITAATTAATTETAPVAPKEAAAAKGDAKVEGAPASEGILGYKGPGLIQSLRFSKRFFWFSDEAFKTDSLDSYLRAEKAEIAHPNAAWAHETGKGLLFFAKRAEDKAGPAGILNLADVSDVTSDGSNEFSFKLHGHKHVFQAASTTERASWIAAIEAKATEAKALKEGIVASEGYKSHIDKYNKFGVGAATTSSALPILSKSKERKETSATPRKSTEAKVKDTVKKDEIKAKDAVKKSDNSSVSSSDIEKKDKKAKSRSQSRKRTSIFGLLSNKKEEQDDKKDVKKEEKAEQKAEKKHEKEVAEEKQHEKAVAKEHHKEETKHEKEIVAAEHKHDKELAKEEKKHEKELAEEEKKHEKEIAKEEKKLEKEEKQAEAKATHQPSDIAEAGAATVAAAAPAALATSSEKKADEKKADETKPEASTTKGTDALEKKTSKRTSIFGSLFGGKKEVTSPTTEKTQNEAAPAVPAKDTTETAPVSETAPKLDEPIQSKPIDTAAVTAPVDSAITAHDPPANSAHAQVTVPSPASKSPTTPSHKGGMMGFFKRQDSKADKKEAKAEEPVTSPATIDETPASSEAPVVAASDSKPTPAVKEKRRTSLFNTLSNKKKTNEPTSETEVTEGETKKSPLPQKLGGLFRRPSKAVKTEETQTEPAAASTEPAPPTETAAAEGAKDTPVKEEPALINGTSDVPTASEDKVPEGVTNPTPIVRASA